MNLRFPPRHIVSHDIEVPETSDFLAKPARLGTEPLHLRAFQHWTEDGKHAAQAPQTDTQLMRAPGVVQQTDNSDVRRSLV